MAGDFIGRTRSGLPLGSALDQRQADDNLRNRQDEEKLANRSFGDSENNDLRNQVADLKAKFDSIQFSCGDGIDITGNAPRFSANVTPWTPPTNVDANNPPAPADFQLLGGSKLQLFGGTVTDTTNAGLVWTPSGLTLGAYTDITPGISGTAYLVISYTEGLPANITAVAYGTAASTPANISGTLYVQLGAFALGAGGYKVNSSPIGSQIFDAWRRWNTFGPVQYGAECNPL